jgi:hypothetical protein
MPARRQPDGRRGAAPTGRLLPAVRCFSLCIGALTAAVDGIARGTVGLTDDSGHSVAQRDVTAQHQRLGLVESPVQLGAVVVFYPQRDEGDGVAPGLLSRGGRVTGVVALGGVVPDPVRVLLRAAAPLGVM